VQISEINAAAVPTPSTGYSQAIELQGHTRMLFISGQIPVGLDGAVPEGFEAQCRLAWRNVEAQLKAAGTSFLRERPSSHRVCTLSLNSMTDLQSRSPGSHGRSHAWYSQARSAAEE